MVARRGFSPPPRVHVELFVTPRSQRARLHRGCRALYAVARSETLRAGGAGPFLFLLGASSRSRRRPAGLRASIGARPSEDVWLELTFYSSGENRRRTLSRLWTSAGFAALATEVERFNVKRKQCWTVANGRLSAV